MSERPVSELRFFELLNDRLRSTQHENDDHLDRAFLPQKIRPGSANDIIGVSNNTAAWISSRLLVPVGSMTAYAGTIAPAGWLLCDGTAVSRSLYADLFSVISTTFGSGDGSTTFNLPDLRGRVPVGLDNLGGVDAGRLSVANTLGGSGGAETHTLTTGEIPSHTHANTATVSSDSAGTPSGTISSDSAGTPSGTISSDSAGTPSINTQSTAGAHTHAVTGLNGWLLSTSGGQGTAASVAVTGASYRYVALPSDGGHTHTFTFNALATHNHTFTGTVLTSHTHAFTGAAMSNHSHTVTMSNASAGGGGAHNNMQPFMLLGYIIKT